MTLRWYSNKYIRKQFLKPYFILSLTFMSIAVFITLNEASGYAQGNYTASTSPVLKAPYTLTFSVSVKQPGNDLKRNTPLTSPQTGTLTVSSNGAKFLYIEKFNKWCKVIICDKSTDTIYLYDNRFDDAIIEPGVNFGLVSMLILPMPGVGYDFYPMFQSFKYSGVGSSHATMAVIGAVTAATNNYIEGMLYQDTIVEIDHKVQVGTISSCKIIVQDRPDLVEEIWKFSKYRMVGSVPVAGTIDHILNAPTSTDIWPPSAMIRNGEVLYTLLSGANTALPDQKYDLESYIPDKLNINDARKKP